VRLCLDSKPNRLAFFFFGRLDAVGCWCKSQISKPSCGCVRKKTRGRARKFYLSESNGVGDLSKYLNISLYSVGEYHSKYLSSRILLGYLPKPFRPLDGVCHYLKTSDSMQRRHFSTSTLYTTHCIKWRRTTVPRH
jgi:hypothetical protein